MSEQRPEPRVPRCYYSVPDVAARYGVHSKKVARLIASGELAAVDLGTRAGTSHRRLFVHIEELERFERARAVSPAVTLPRRRRQSGAMEYV